MTSSNESPRVVVGVDGSESSIYALRWAARLASGLGAGIDAVTAWELPNTYGFVAYPEDYRPDVDAASVLDTALTDAFGENRPPGLRERVAKGNPAQVLTEASHDATMVVVGSRGHGGFAGLLLGSVSSYVAEHAACPVLVIRRGARGLGEPVDPATADR